MGIGFPAAMKKRNLADCDQCKGKTVKGTLHPSGPEELNLKFLRLEIRGISPANSVERGHR
jgi:hypothetical protein